MSIDQGDRAQSIRVATKLGVDLEISFSSTPQDVL